jgi:hypothetical protein
MVYMDCSGKGLMIPSRDSLDNLYYDYMSSVYWFATGMDGFSIKSYGKFTGLFPINVPVTGLIPTRRGTPTDPSVSITYHYNHHEFMNPEIIYDFNYTIDKCRDMNPGALLENDVVPSLNGKLEKWKKDNWIVSWKSFLAGSKQDRERARKYDRYMGTSSVNGEDQYDLAVFYPVPANQWTGHPYIWDGKLVYTSIS